jgi:hypothetical protein
LSLGGLCIPHVSLEPDSPLNPQDPFSAQFRVTNENQLFTIRNLTGSCYFVDVVTDHNVGISALGRPLTKVIPGLEPRQGSTIDCPSIIGGIGAGAGNVTKAKIVLQISYRQNWWPFAELETYPFEGMRDAQGFVRWFHRAPSEL